jgi:hypothetical protein
VHKVPVPCGEQQVDTSPVADWVKRDSAGGMALGVNNGGKENRDE